MLYLAIAVFCGVLTALIYNAKGNPPLGGFLTGLILGPLGLVLALFVSSAPALQDRACPHCAEPIKPAATVCKHCQRDVEPVL